MSYRHDGGLHKQERMRRMTRTEGRRHPYTATPQAPGPSRVPGRVGGGCTHLTVKAPSGECGYPASSEQRHSQETTFPHIYFFEL